MLRETSAGTELRPPRPRSRPPRPPTERRRIGRDRTGRERRRRTRWDRLGHDAEDFLSVEREFDGHRTCQAGEEKGTFWGAIAEDIAAVEPPTGFHGLISWLFLPAVAAGMYLDVPVEYLYIGAALFAVVFCIIEMDKPDKPRNFEPQICTMERGARDKLIADHNTIDIWDFNEQYGDLWDFTIVRDDTTKRRLLLK